MVLVEVHQASWCFLLNMKVARNRVVLEDAVFGSYFMLRYHITVKTIEPKVFDILFYIVGTQYLFPYA